MHKITNTTTVTTKPTPSYTGTAGYFWQGDIPTNAPATLVGFDWLNSVQDEICNVITDPTGGNTTLSNTVDNQLLTAIKLIVSNAVGAIQAIPVGSIFHMAQSAVPTGYLFCDGTAVSRSTYSALFTAIGTTYGTGNGTTTFNLPDFRGVFLRGLDAGRGLDPSRAIATYQADMFAAHNHTYDWSSSRQPQSGSSTACWYGDSTQYTGTTGGSETVPKNVAVYTVIKY
jgi:microcystin-dependent protein